MSELKTKGRKVNPNSKRQQRLAARLSGEPAKRGRAVDPNSKNQQKLAARLAKNNQPAIAVDLTV